MHLALPTPAFANPAKEIPLLISRRREAKRRALLQMLDRIPVRSERPTPIAKPAGVPADVPLPRAVPGVQNRLPK